jgi:hypothetical protein
MLNNPFAFLISPAAQWQKVAAASLNQQRTAAIYVAVFALFPCFAWYHGTTEIGWRVGAGELVKLTAGSALLLIAAFYAAIMLALAGIGLAIHWMAGTYGSIASFTAWLCHRRLWCNAAFYRWHFRFLPAAVAGYEPRHSGGQLGRLSALHRPAGGDGRSRRPRLSLCQRSDCSLPGIPDGHDGRYRHPVGHGFYA